MPLEIKNKITCTGCGLVCDDISSEVQLNRVYKIYNACLRGNKKYHFSHDKNRLTKARIQDDKGDGNVQHNEVSIDDALIKAAEMLKNASNPLIVGCAHVSNQAQELIIKLSNTINADIGIPDFKVFNKIKKISNEIGQEFFTLGECINNADMLVFWGANPIDSAPKLVVKSVFSRGLYRQSGKEVKKFIVIDDYPSPTMERADIKLLTDDENPEIILKSLIAKLFSNEIVDEEFISFVGYSVDELKDFKVPEKYDDQINDFVEIIKYLEYGVLFLGESLMNDNFLTNNTAFMEKLYKFTKALNKKARLAMLPLFNKFNYLGFYKALQILDININVKDFNDVVNDLDKHDVIIAIGYDFVSKLNDASMAKLKNSKIIVLDYKENFTTDIASITIPVAITGIETGGIVTRTDGIIVKLNPVIDKPSGIKTDEEILSYFIDNIK
ncbi:MAG: molybdopterin-dependent oxidoreductase [Promethearchaeota archaeon]